MYNEELEKAMLYYLIFEQEEYLLDENDFVDDRNKRIIKAINDLKAEKRDVSILSITSRIKANDRKVLEYLTRLGEYIRTTNADTIYNELIELSKKRRLFQLLQEKTMQIAECENIDILAQQIVKETNKIEQVNEKEKTFLQQVIETTQKIEKDTLETPDYLLYTGILDLDRITCGLHKQELTIIGARPRCRKNDTCFTNSRIYSDKGSRNSDSKPRNVRYANYSKNACKKNKSK